MEKKKKKSFFVLMLLLLIISLVITNKSFYFAKVFASESEEKVSNKKVKETKSDIKTLENKIEKAEAYKKSLENKLSHIQGSVYYTQKEINKTKRLIKDTEENIARMEAEIKQINNRLEVQKKILAGLTWQFYKESKKPLLLGLLGEGSLAQATFEKERITILKEKILALIDDIKKDKEKFTKSKEKLSDSKEEKNKLLSLKQAQQHSLLQEKQITQSRVAKKNREIANMRARLSRLRVNLSRMLGKVYNTQDIEEAAKIASKSTGVRKDFLMGMLVVESDLGRYTGGCNYKESRMSSYRKKIFKDICKSLDLNYKKQKVSCPPKSYRGTGGAMGVAQFMPDTWNAYKTSIALHTGHNPPNPWNLVDGVTAMALKLAKVPGVTSHKKSGEKNAAKLYLSGSTSSKFNWYAERVLYWADHYEKLLNN